MSGSIEIEALYGHKEFTPGDTLSGKVRWSAGGSPVEEIVVRLFWFTTGRGTEDTGITAEQSWQTGGAAHGEEAFSFTLPWEPYSFSGSLITLTWALEAVLKPEDTACLFEFVLSPSGKEILLEPVQNPVTGAGRNMSSLIEKKLNRGGGRS